MDNEYQILTHLEKNQDSSQRRIAHGTGLSVGTVNLLLKKMVRKGLVKIERLNARTLRYIITPKGMAEKTRLAYQFMKSSYRQIIKLHHALEQIVNDRVVAGSRPEVVFYGPQDEILEILKTAAGEMNLQYTMAQTPYELAAVDPEAAVIITWHTEEVDQALTRDLSVVNILEKI